jgi:hypothetical protein
LQSIQPVYIFIEHPLINTDRYKKLRMVRNFLMYRHLLTAWVEKDFTNDTMSTIAWQGRVARLLTADKAGHHANDDDLNALKDSISLLPWPEGVGRDANVCPATYIDDFKLQYNLRNERKENMYLHLLHQYVNVRIARMYRAMLECAMLYTPIPKADLYFNDERKAVTLADLFPAVKTGDEAEISLLDGRTEKLNLTGSSRRQWLAMVLRAMEISIEKQMTTADNFEGLTRSYKFATSTEGMGYSAEHMACLLMDFFFSAMKHSTAWEREGFPAKGVNPGDYGTNPVYRFNYYAQNNKCKVCITSEDGENPERYRWLVFTSKTNESEESKDGLSIAAMKWYADGLWSDHKNKRPEAKAGPDGEGNYIIQLPILIGTKKGKSI